MNKLMIAFGTLALAVASAGTSYRVTLYQPAQVAGTTLKPGDYKVEVSDSGTVSFKQGKITAEAKAKVEEGTSKILSTTVDVDGDTKQLKEIRLGGTNKIIVLEKSGTASGN